MSIVKTVLELFLCKIYLHGADKLKASWVIQLFVGKLLAFRLPITVAKSEIRYYEY